MGLRDLLNKGRNAIESASGAVQRGVVGAYEAVNPWDAESKGNALVDKTANQYRFTPSFKREIASTNPYVIDGGWRESEALSDGAKAEAAYYPRQGYGAANSRMRVSPSVSNKGNALFHEGLHSAWDSTPKTRTDFVSAYNQSATPDLRRFLVRRTSPYAAHSRQPEDAFMDLNRMTPDLQTEIHSFVPEYYQQRQQPMPSQLESYYNQYYDASALRKILGVEF